MSWILDRGWIPFWALGWFFWCAIVFPILYGLDILSHWMWDKHPSKRQWIARNLGI